MKPIVPSALQALRPQIFFGQPYCTISQFPEHLTSIEQLPAVERNKIDDAAEFVVDSLLRPTHTGGIVIAIGIRGHADQELKNRGPARLDFEQKISEERASRVASALNNAIRDEAYRLEAAPLPEGDPFELVIEGVGAKMLLKNHPTNDHDRALNRRVDIFFLKDWAALSRMDEFDVPPQKAFNL
jgi:outer membrane protein OmpA-like peptidoglycan-associated protein